MSAWACFLSKTFIYCSQRQITYRKENREACSTEKQKHWTSFRSRKSREEVFVYFHPFEPELVLLSTFVQKLFKQNFQPSVFHLKFPSLCKGFKIRGRTSLGLSLYARVPKLCLHWIRPKLWNPPIRIHFEASPNFKLYKRLNPKSSQWAGQFSRTDKLWVQCWD